MIKFLESPERICAIQLIGKLTKDDIERVDGVLEKQRETFGELLLYFEVVEFSYASVEAFWTDLKADIKYFSDCEKVAIATEKEWMGQLSSFLGKITPIEVNVYHLDDRDKAYAWLC